MYGYESFESKRDNRATKSSEISVVKTLGYYFMATLSRTALTKDNL